MAVEGEKREQRGAGGAASVITPVRESAGLARWLRGRAHNVRGRLLLVAAVGALAMLTTLVVLIVVLYAERRSYAAVASPAQQRPDTARMTAVLDLITARLDSANGRLADARAASMRRAAARQAIDTLPAPLRAQRDALLGARVQLGQLLKRAENSPLLSSYREIGTAVALRGDPLVAQLLDSLAQIDQSRTDLTPTRGIDPVFFTLTTRAADIGRRIQAIARARYAALRAEADRIAPTAPHAEMEAEADTTPIIAARDSLARGAATVRAALTRAHVRLVVLDAEAARAREAAATGATPLEMLAAATMIGLVAGFAVALLIEIRRPRIASAAEAAQAVAAPVLAHLRHRGAMPERARRRADREVSPHIDQTTEDYRLLYARLSDSGFNMPLIAVVGEDPGITAVVAANLATAAAQHARTTVLVDTDIDTTAVATLLGVRSSPGVVDVAAERLPWVDAVVPVLVGRDQFVDVLPSGRSSEREAERAIVATLERELPKLGRRYDTVIVNLPATRPTMMASTAGAVGAVLVCARLGRTRTASVRALAELVRLRYATVRGVVLWAMDEPLLLTPGASGRSGPHRTLGVLKRATEAVAP